MPKCKISSRNDSTEVECERFLRLYSHKSIQRKLLARWKRRGGRLQPISNVKTKPTKRLFSFPRAENQLRWQIDPSKLLEGEKSSAESSKVFKTYYLTANQSDASDHDHCSQQQTDMRCLIETCCGHCFLTMDGDLPLFITRSLSC